MPVLLGKKVPSPPLGSPSQDLLGVKDAQVGSHSPELFWVQAQGGVSLILPSSAASGLPADSPGPPLLHIQFP